MDKSFATSYMARKYAKGGKAKLGSGKRFASLEHSLAHEKGVTNPQALAASIGQKKYGAEKMAKMAAHNRKAMGGEIEGFEDREGMSEYADGGAVQCAHGGPMMCAYGCYSGGQVNPKLMESKKYMGGLISDEGDRSDESEEQERFDMENSMDDDLDNEMGDPAGDEVHMADGGMMEDDEEEMPKKRLLSKVFSRISQMHKGS